MRKREGGRRRERGMKGGREEMKTVVTSNTTTNITLAYMLNLPRSSPSLYSFQMQVVPPTRLSRTTYLPDSPEQPTYQTLQNNLSAAATALNIVGSEVVAAASDTEQQAEATSKCAHCFEELLTAGLAGVHEVCRCECMWASNGRCCKASLKAPR